MKSHIRIFSGILLTALYGFALSIVSQSPPDELQLHASSVQEHFVADLSAKLSHHSAQTESLVFNCTNLSAPSFKNPSIVHLAIEVMAAQLVRTELYERIAFSRKALIHQRKSDILFPFHFFW